MQNILINSELLIRNLKHTDYLLEFISNKY